MKRSSFFVGAVVVAVLAGAVLRFSPFGYAPAATVAPVVDGEEGELCEAKLARCREMAAFENTLFYRVCLRRLATPLIEDPSAWSVCAATAFRLLVESMHTSVTSVPAAEKETDRDAGTAYLAVVLGSGLALCIERGEGSCEGVCDVSVVLFCLRLTPVRKVPRGTICSPS